MRGLIAALWAVANATKGCSVPSECDCCSECIKLNAIWCSARMNRGRHWKLVSTCVVGSDECHGLGLHPTTRCQTEHNGMELLWWGLGVTAVALIIFLAYEKCMSKLGFKGETQQQQQQQMNLINHP
eukprot:GEMP01059458.1.p1 GENE.GEMP01059458.1~~GEMP01059458.1.p1  ORF type:complete len:127 (+),score=24.34 GEMP01059458.1:58-438(+)